MSYALDANVLLHAANADSPQNARAVQFLTECARRGEVICLAWSTIMAFLRIGTHPGVFPDPLSWDQAAGYVEALINLPHARLLSELDGFWPVYRSVAGGVFARGNLIPDTHLAAILKQNGVRTLYTSDTDFRKFDFLDVRDPFD